MKPYLIFIIILIALASCGQKQTFTSPQGYDFNKPYIINLPHTLEEISGLTYYQKDKSVFSIVDEAGILFKITPGEQTKVRQWKYASKADYEDLVLLDSTFFVLESNGDMHILNFKGNDTIITDQVKFPFGKKNEFETLYFDPAIKKLVLICKSCSDDNKKSLTTFTFDPKARQFSDSSYSLNIKELADSMGVKTFRFKPSAAAIDPLTNDLFVLSSVNKLLVVLDKNHVIKHFYPLNPALFKQPEGIAFSETGTLMFSNESHDVGTANLLIYNRIKP